MKKIIIGVLYLIIGAIIMWHLVWWGKIYTEDRYNKANNFQNKK